MVTLNNFSQRQSLAFHMQPKAIDKIYNKLWPGARIHEGDIAKDDISQLLDRVGNTDKTVITSSAVIQVAQRIRQFDVWDKYPDFTLRQAEYLRMKNAFDVGGMLPGYYGYGYATKTLDDFRVFFVIRFADWFAYINNGIVPSQHQPRFKNRNGSAENFYFVPWNCIPSEFFVARYILGFPNDIQPIGKKKNVTIQLSLWQ